jgi:hypothetical protein
MPLPDKLPGTGKRGMRAHRTAPTGRKVSRNRRKDIKAIADRFVKIIEPETISARTIIEGVGDIIQAIGSLLSQVAACAERHGQIHELEETLKYDDMPGGVRADAQERLDDLRSQQRSECGMA